MIEKDLQIDERMCLNIDIMEIPESCVVVISDGKAKLRELPPHGEYKIVTHQGKSNGCGGRWGKSFEW